MITALTLLSIEKENDKLRKNLSKSIKKNRFNFNLFSYETRNIYKKI
jgi:hypothetical protein